MIEPSQKVLHDVVQRGTTRAMSLLAMSLAAMLLKKSALVIGAPGDKDAEIIERDCVSLAATIKQDGWNMVGDQGKDFLIVRTTESLKKALKVLAQQNSGEVLIVVSGHGEVIDKKPTLVVSHGDGTQENLSWTDLAATVATSRPVLLVPDT